MDNFIFTCPFCGQRIECPNSMNGVATKCPTCGKEIVPDAEIAKDVEENPEQEKQSIPQNPPVKSEVSDMIMLFGSNRVSENDPPCPLLTQIYRWIGAVHVLIAVVGFFVLMVGIGDNKDSSRAYSSSYSNYSSYSSTSRSNDGAQKILWGIAMIITGAGGAIFSFGVAELIQYIGNISHYSRKTFELLAEEKDKKIPKTA